MRRSLIFATLAASTALAHAQTEPTGGVVPAARGAPAFEPKLTRLLEVMGSVQFLRQLCAPGEEDVWRERAVELIDAEGDTDTRRERLTASFNRGYRAFSTYTTCTEAAVFAIDGYMREGETLTREILVRYGE